MKCWPLLLCLLFCGCPSNSKTKVVAKVIAEKTLSWEKIEHPYKFTIYRTKTPSGWLVTFERYSENAFNLQIDDPTHSWIPGSWEPLTHPKSMNMYRMKVPAGWILTSERSTTVAQAEFIFDAAVKDNKLLPNTQDWAK